MKILIGCLSMAYLSGSPLYHYELARELKKQGKSIIISTHIMSLVEKLCDRVGLIFNGKMVICDTLDKVLDSVPSRDLEEVFIKLYQEEGAQ